MASCGAGEGGKDVKTVSGMKDWDSPRSVGEGGRGMVMRLEGKRAYVVAEISVKTGCFGEEGEHRVGGSERGAARLSLEEGMNDHGASGSTHTMLWCKGGCSREFST